MGGTFARLVEHGHDVHVAYQTSGSIAVSDDDAIRYLYFVRHYEKIYGITEPKAELLYKESTDFYNNKKKDSIEPSELLAIKASIRRGEATASVSYTHLDVYKRQGADLLKTTRTAKQLHSLVCITALPTRCTRLMYVRRKTGIAPM